MRRLARRGVPLLVFLSCLVPQVLPAQVAPFLDPAYTLGGATTFNGVTSIIATARVTLYDAGGVRIFKQVIMGHGIADLTANVAIYQERFVSEIGDAKNDVTRPGVLGHCYEADIAGHANAFNLHEAWAVGPFCPQPPERSPKPTVEIPDENCPVLLDLQLDGFHLSGPVPGVRFDIDADGIPDEIAWTRAGEDDAFLCWDRNGNGVIDNGRELFGFSSPLISGEPARIGFRALAEIDQAELGGNQDGKVDANDARFHDLCAWVDRNRDGLSEPSEIHSLDEVGVVALSYTFSPTHVRDSFGNLFRYVSSVEMRSLTGPPRIWPTFDVIFAEVMNR